MAEIKTFKQQDLVLNVRQVYNPLTLDLDAWMPFIQRLCGERTYQKEAIIQAVIYLASGNYQSLSELAAENYQSNSKLREKYASFEDFSKLLQIPNHLYASLDLATGAGKSYVIYGIAQVMLGLGIIDRVLVLCPSLTIESGLMEKFEQLSSDPALKRLIPDTAVLKNPSIVSANQTVKTGDLCVENIHAVYASTGSSIEDSFKGSGARVLVLNDEAHHIFNKVSGTTASDSDIKKWKSFLTSPDYNFHYILGFTGTAYINDEYFTDVIYRYSLRDAISASMVKNVDYVKEDDSKNDWERFQKIYANHMYNKDIYSLIKPLTIMVTKDIKRARLLQADLIDFLVEKEHLSKEEIEKKVLIVTSHRDHKANIPRLREVDNSADPVEWIVSVSMLTEGWDVKNVFQIVPWEDRAFNSKLLIAQVLGRGLRVPPQYPALQPRVIVFNHKSWSRKIKKLVDEVLEIETRIYSQVLIEDDRSQYHFTVKNIDYSHEQIEVDSNKDNLRMDFSRLLKEGIALESQSIQEERNTVYNSALGGHDRSQNYMIENITYTVDEILDKIYDEFEQREWEGKVLKLGENEYTQNNLPPRETLEKIIDISMKKRGNTGDLIIEKNAHRILTAFSPLLRRKSKSVVSRLKMEDTFELSTKDLHKDSTGIGNLRRDHSLFYASSWRQEFHDVEQIAVMEELIEDESLPRSALKEQNQYLFKTPVNTVITSCEPERKFVNALCKRENAAVIDSWIKSRDRSFYEIEYNYRYGSPHSKTRKYFHGKFNPDFFIVTRRNNMTYILVVETKADQDVSEENKAKYRHGIEHFRQLNKRMEEQGISERYLFHFLSPNSYSSFFEHLRTGTLLENQEHYRCELENLLEAAEN